MGRAQHASYTWTSHHVLVPVVPAYIGAVESPVTVVTGFPSSLHCPAQGDPTPLVTWTFNNQPFPPPGSTPRITVANGNQSISLTETVKSDEGVYTCTASNSLLSVSMAISLVVYSKLAVVKLPWLLHSLHSVIPIVPPTIVTLPVSLQPVEGGKILLDCVANGDPPPTISWQRNNVPLTPSTDRCAPQPQGQSPAISLPS